MKNRAAAFDKAASFLTPRLSAFLGSVGAGVKESVYEIRLRSGRPLVLTGAQGSFFLFPNGRVSMILSESAVRVSHAEVGECLRRLCGYSLHSSNEAIINGFIALEGGHRAGVCGCAVLDCDRVSGVRDVNSINLRIAREFPGAADGLFESLFSQGLCSAVIAGPPVSGKTTMLRDLARRLSGEQGGEYYRVAVADERGEIASVYRGEPQSDIGINCDVLSGYPKGEAVLLALRSLSPQIIICDEVGGEQDVKAIEEAMNSGVHFLVSAHASGIEDFQRRPQLKRLLSSGAFDKLVFLKAGRVPCVVEKIYDVKEPENESGGNDFAGARLHTFGRSSGAQADSAGQTA